jgi:hypothetical protein
MHHPHDQLFKEMMDATLELMGKVEPERVVHVPPQRIDVAFEPHGRAPALGVLDRMAALGPCMFEYYARQPSRADVEACLRKRLNYDHERTLRARRRGKPAPASSRLWILSTGRPRVALQAYGAAPMTGWPEGFWQAAMDDRLCCVVLSELPEREDTLSLRLLQRGPGVARALSELDELPETHPLRVRTWPVLVARRAPIMQHLKRIGAMSAFQQAQEIFHKWEQRALQKGRRQGLREGIRQGIEQGVEQGVDQGREQEARALLERLVRRRFGRLPRSASARIRQADRATLERWAEQVLTARSIDDVFA